MKVIYLDENLSKPLADALHSLLNLNFPEIQIRSTIDRFGVSAKDEDIIPEIAKEGNALLTLDVNIHRTKSQSKLVDDHKLGVVFMKMPSGAVNNWEITKTILRHWEEIEKVIRKEKPPYRYKLAPKSFNKME